MRIISKVQIYPFEEYGHKLGGTTIDVSDGCVSVPELHRLSANDAQLLLEALTKAVKLARQQESNKEEV